MKPLVVLLLLGTITIAHADPSTDLRDGNAAAIANDWARVQALVYPLLAQQLAKTDLAEAHRLAGLAAFFTNRPEQAEAEFFAYLKIELDGQLDPAVYPPEAISFFANVRLKHDAELRALRPKPANGSVWRSLIPPYGQYKNGEHTKALVLGITMFSLLATNVTTYLVLRKWCSVDAGTSGAKATCDDGNGTNHVSGATTLRSVNIAAGLGFIAAYVYGVYDGVHGFRRRAREMSMMPVMTTSPTSSTIGLSWTW